MQTLHGWMNNSNYHGNIPISPWRSAMSIPRQLGLKTINGRIQLTQQPVRQVTQLHTGRPAVAVNQSIKGTVPAGICGATLDLDGVFAPGTATTFGVNVHTGNGELTRIGYDTSTAQVFIDRTKSGNTTFDPTHDIILLITVPQRVAGAGKVLLNGTMSHVARDLRVCAR